MKSLSQEPINGLLLKCSNNMKATEQHARWQSSKELYWLSVVKLDNDDVLFFQPGSLLTTIMFFSAVHFSNLPNSLWTDRLASQLPLSYQANFEKFNSCE